MGTSKLRQAEIIMALSLATDLGTGQPLERGLRTCLLAYRMGQIIGLDKEDLRTVYYVALLRFVGCTSDARHLMEIFGNELVAQAQVSTVELLPTPMLLAILRYAGQADPLLERIQRVGYGFKNGISHTHEAEVAHCEVSQNIAEHCGLTGDVLVALGQIFERWDGRGTPLHLKEERLSTAIRLVHVAQDAEVFYRINGVEATIQSIRKRAGGFYDPDIVNTFITHSQQLLSELNQDNMWEIIQNLEPHPHLYLTGDSVESAFKTIADFVDLRSPYTHNHSTAVGNLAYEVARQCGLPDEEALELRYAGYVHDIGRLSISLSIWEKASHLTTMEFEQVRLYPYYTECILSRSPSLVAISKLATLHRERLDGSGYHRGVPASLLNMSARVLAACDVFQSKMEVRPYRPALTEDMATKEMLNQVQDGKLDKEVVAALVEVATGKRLPVRQTFKTTLTKREIEVLRLLAQGFLTRQIAEHLNIAHKTADHHIQHIYNKIGVSTRAAATLFAMQNNLLKDFPLEE